MGLASLSGGTTTAPIGMPVGRRTPRGKRRWYLVHAPEREAATCDKLRRLVDPELLEDAFVMRKERWRKRKGDGEWERYLVPMFSDYFFVATSDVAALDRELAKLTFPARIARTDGHHFAPMDADAQAWYEQMMDEEHVIRSSTGVIVDGVLQLQEGPLVGQEANVVKVNRPRRFCSVEVGNGIAAGTPAPISNKSGFREFMPLVIPFKS